MKKKKRRTTKIDFFDYDRRQGGVIIIKRGTVDFDQIYRILEIDLKIGREGQKKITLKIAKEGTASLETETEEVAVEINSLSSVA